MMLQGGFLFFTGKP